MYGKINNIAHGTTARESLKYKYKVDSRVYCAKVKKKEWKR
jgi:hypothetical protein